MLTEDPTAEAAKIVTEADLVRAEMQALLDSLNGSRASKAVLRQARQLRLRAKALGAITERLLCREMAVGVAIRQRLGRTNVEGEEILPADEFVADRILSDLDRC